jgi:hypothetical protein
LVADLATNPPEAGGRTPSLPLFVRRAPTEYAARC